MRETEIRCQTPGCGKLIGYKAAETQVSAGYVRIECRHCKQPVYIGTKPTEDVKQQAA